MLSQVRREYSDMSLEEAVKKWQELIRDFAEGQSDEQEICEGLSNDQLGILWLAREVSRREPFVVFGDLEVHFPLQDLGLRVLQGK